jgi:hypothetical protein
VNHPSKNDVLMSNPINKYEKKIKVEKYFQEKK